MYKIAVVDDDEHWCLAIQSFFQKSFEVTLFQGIPYSLHELVDYDLVMAYCLLKPEKGAEINSQGFEIIRFLKSHIPNPPLLIIISDSLSQDKIELGRKIFPEADAFFAKDTDREVLLQQTLQLINSKHKKLFQQSNQSVSDVKAMYTMAVIDDDKHWCFTLDRFFRNEFEVYTFPTASDFLKQSFEFDLVIVDYSIPHLYYEDYVDSRELIHYLKNLRYPPLVMLVSGYVSKNDSVLGKNICPEADGFCAKDAGLDELSRKIRDLLGCKR